MATRKKATSAAPTDQPVVTTGENAVKQASSTSQENKTAKAGGHKPRSRYSVATAKAAAKTRYNNA